MNQQSIIQKISLGTISAIIISTLGGEMVRLPFGPGLGILPSDLFLACGVILLFCLTGWNFFKTKKHIGTALLLFIAVAFLTWLNGTKALSANESMESFLYLARFTLYAMLFFIAHKIEKSKVKTIYNVMLGVGIGLAILGFIQLQFFPSFLELEMQKLGWDPHENRLLSTWFDPNFIGGLFAFLIGINCEKLFSKKNNKMKLISACGLGIILIALFLTYSRSSYLALATTIGVFGLIRSRKLVIGLCIVVLVFTAVSQRAQERIGGIFQSVRSLTQEQSGELPDATARLRIASWENTIEIFKEHPLLGVGFNAFKFAQIEKGFLQDENNHAGSGSDASLLTILVTTGVIGFSVFLWLLFTILKETLRTKNYGLFAALCGLLVHSLFVNSMLLPFVMIYLWISVGLNHEKLTE